MFKRIELVTLVLIFVVAAGVSAAYPGTQGQAPAPKPEVKRVNINKADAEQLQALPGIGPGTAERIIRYREQHGPFQRIEELMNVRGIGPRRFARLKDRITV